MTAPVDFTLDVPNPILHYAWDTWYMMDKEWSEANNALQPSAPQDTTPSFAVLNANGTGPFKISEHQLGVRTTFEKNPNWWGKVEHNLDRVIFTPILSAPTRVAALLSGEVDIIDPVPLQDVARINGSANARVLEGPEIRTIYLSFDQMRPELTASSIKGKNPFKDVRVRKAFYQAVDIEAIRRQVMRGAATPSSTLISPLLFPKAAEIKRHPFDLAAANKLLDEAGYPRGADRQPLRGGSRLPERPLRQRRSDLPGRDRDAGARWHQDQSAGGATRAVLREGQLADLQHAVLPARLDARHDGRPQRAERPDDVPHA